MKPERIFAALLLVSMGITLFGLFQALHLLTQIHQQLLFMGAR